MGLLEVSSGGLRTLAARCHSLSAELAGGSVHTPVEVDGQATAKAVNAAHDGAARAARAMVARLRETAAAVEDAGCGYALEEGQSAAAVRELVSEA
jgi:hypothetical protein